MKKKKTVRKCSVCRMPGHTKRTCAMRSVKKATTRSAPKQVRVSVSKKTPQSKHVLDLKKQTDLEKTNVWQTIRAHKDHKAPAPIRKTLDLAALVRTANANTATQKVVPPRTPKKKLVQRRKKQRPQIHVPIREFAIRVQQSATDTVVFVRQRVAVTLVIIALLVAIPFPAIGYYNQIRTDGERIVAQSTDAFMSLQSSTIAALHANLDQAKYDLNNALTAFGEARSIIEQDHQMLAYVAGMLPVVGKQVTGRQDILTAGQHLALGNTYLVRGLDATNKDTTAPLTDRLHTLRQHIDSATRQYKRALEQLAGIDPSILPTKYQQSFQEFKLLFAVFVDDMSDIADLAGLMEDMFGADHHKKYLVMFQNHHELRPTGGFLGSYAIVDVQKGKILNIEVPPEGTYDLQGQLGEYLNPPLPLQIINKRWEFQDANWFPDFGASAQKISWFYREARGATVDGVIAVNASVLERFLRVVGPVQSDEYDLLLDADTALTEIQEEVEVGEDVEKGTPKAIIATLLEQFLGGVTAHGADDMLRLLTELHAAAEQKEVQVYVEDTTVQQKLRTFGWTGEMTPTSDAQDYLAVIHTNLHGQKSDARMNQHIDHQAAVQEDGSVVNTVTITREHTGEVGEQFYGVNNVSYLRVYVPEGAELLDATGFVFPPEDVFEVPEFWYVDDVHLRAIEQEPTIHLQTGTRVTKEFGKTVFGNWMMVAPGNVEQVTLTYRLPFRVFDTAATVSSDPNGPLGTWKQVFTQGAATPEASRYSLVAQKQSGIESAFTSKVQYPEDWKPVWRVGDDTALSLHGVTVDATLETDTIFGVVMEKQSDE